MNGFRDAYLRTIRENTPELKDKDKNTEHDQAELAAEQERQLELEVLVQADTSGNSIQPVWSRGNEDEARTRRERKGSGYPWTKGSV